MKLLKYIKGLVNFYGIIHVDKIVEIYNQQNKKKIEASDLRAYRKKGKRLFKKPYFTFHKDYFVNREVEDEKTFERDIAIRKMLPYYIPEKNEILTHHNIPWYEPSETFENLYFYMEEKFSYVKAKEVSFEIYDYCLSLRKFERINEYIENLNLPFEDTEDMFELLVLLVNFFFYVRVQEFNGLKLIEIEKFPEDLRIFIRKEFPEYSRMMNI